MQPTKHGAPCLINDIQTDRSAPNTDASWMSREGWRWNTIRQCWDERFCSWIQWKATCTDIGQESPHGLSRCHQWRALSTSMYLHSFSDAYCLLGLWNAQRIPAYCRWPASLHSRSWGYTAAVQMFIVMMISMNGTYSFITSVSIRLRGELMTIWWWEWMKKKIG